jgi:hypothetical protein
LITFAASAVLTLAQALPIRADGLTLATVNCTDGSSFSATVDADTLTGLQQAIQAMTLYPAGLGCTLATAPVLTAIGGVASAWTASGFVVGGGRFQLSCPDGSGAMFWTNFGLSAHNVDGTTNVDSGTFNLSIPDGPTQCVGPSNFTSKPYCLVISNEPPGPPSSPWWAWINSTVTEVHGDFFTNVAGLRSGSTHGGGVKDTGNPGQQTIGPDRIAPRPFATSCPSVGDPPQDDTYFGWHDVLNGNITIHPKSQL